MHQDRCAWTAGARRPGRLASFRQSPSIHRRCALDQRPEIKRVVGAAGS